MHFYSQFVFIIFFFLLHAIYKLEPFTAFTRLILFRGGVDRLSFCFLIYFNRFSFILFLKKRITKNMSWINTSFALFWGGAEKLLFHFVEWSWEMSLYVQRINTCAMRKHSAALCSLVTIFVTKERARRARKLYQLFVNVYSLNTARNQFSAFIIFMPSWTLRVHSKWPNQSKRNVLVELIKDFARRSLKSVCPRLFLHHINIVSSCFNHLILSLFAYKKLGKNFNQFLRIIVGYGWRKREANHKETLPEQ